MSSTQTVPKARPNMDLSIVVPTHNRRDRLLVLLESLARQTESYDAFEVIVVIDGSTDGTQEALRQGRWPFRLVAEPAARGGVETARNRGVARASGKACLFLDDDIVADERLVANHLQVQRDKLGVVTIGRLAKLLKQRRLAGLVTAPSNAERSRPPRSRALTNLLDCYGGNLCVPRELFLQVGGFATDIRVDGMRFGLRYNDIELGFRLQKHGARFIYVDDACAVEDDQETLRDHVSDAEKRGASGLALYDRHPALLPHLALGRWSELDGKWGTIRGGLFAFHVPPLLVGSMGRFVPTHKWARSWYQLLFNYCYWRGVERALSQRGDRNQVLRALRSGRISAATGIAQDTPRSQCDPLKGQEPGASHCDSLGTTRDVKIRERPTPRPKRHYRGRRRGFTVATGLRSRHR